MTDTPTQQPARPAPKPARAAQKWRASDLAGYAAEWGCSRAAVRAAFRSSGKDSVATPDEAQKMVREYLGQDLAKLEADAIAQRKREAKEK